MRLDQRPNNFDFIRLAAASMVLVDHQHTLVVQPAPRLFGLLDLGTFGVLIFFSVSGYLVAQSWDRDPHIWRFAVKRFLRIWPALLVVTCIAAFVVGPAQSTLPFREYFAAPGTWSYLSQLYLHIEGGRGLPGVFAHNVWKMVNGSLWTIPIEVRWYGILLLFGACGLLRPRFRYPLLALLVAYAVYIYGVFDVQHNPLAQGLLPDFGIEYGTYFCFGAMLHYFRDVWSRHLALTGCVAVVLAAALTLLAHGYTAVFLLLPLVAIGFGSASTPVLRRFGRFGDFSYGIYIYAFMLQQVVLAHWGYQHSYALLLLLSALFTLGCAVLSWYGVERPALGLKRRLGVKAEDPPGPDMAASMVVDVARDRP